MRHATLKMTSAPSSLIAIASGSTAAIRNAYQNAI